MLKGIINNHSFACMQLFNWQIDFSITVTGNSSHLIPGLGLNVSSVEPI